MKIILLVAFFVFNAEAAMCQNPVDAPIEVKGIARGFAIIPVIIQVVTEENLAPVGGLFVKVSSRAFYMGKIDASLEEFAMAVRVTDNLGSALVYLPVQVSTVNENLTYFSDATITVRLLNGKIATKSVKLHNARREDFLLHLIKVPSEFLDNEEKNKGSKNKGSGEK